MNGYGIYGRTLSVFALILATGLVPWLLPLTAFFLYRIIRKMVRTGRARRAFRADLTARTREARYAALMKTNW